MDYYARIQKSIDFIEDNLTSYISLDEISKKAYSSLSHFHRIFAFMTGFTIKEYIRKRRLCVAAHELLCTDANVLDIALKYQYSTHETFTRAFKKNFGQNPLKFRKTRMEHVLFNKINIYDEKYKSRYRDETIAHRFVTYNRFFVTGFKIETSLENNRAATDIPLFWNSFFEKKLFEKIPDIKGDKGLFGIYSNLDFQNNFDFAICCQVDTLKQIPADLYTLEIPARNYAVFTAKGKMPEKLVNTWHYIYGNWLPNSIYEREKGIDFESYSPDFGQTTESSVDIYIPLKIVGEYT